MTKNRREKLQDEISTLEDAILYAESKGSKNLEEARDLLNKVKGLFEHGSWSMVERVLTNAPAIKSSHWYREFVEKRGDEQKRFIDDGLCGKYGHLMVQVRLSNVRWYYQCRLCGKRGKYRSIK